VSEIFKNFRQSYKKTQKLIILAVILLNLCNPLIALLPTFRQTNRNAIIVQNIRLLQTNRKLPGQPFADPALAPSQQQNNQNKKQQSKDFPNKINDLDCLSLLVFLLYLSLYHSHVQYLI
jgi:hypothetical protein